MDELFVAWAWGDGWRKTPASCPPGRRWLNMQYVVHSDLELLIDHDADGFLIVIWHHREQRLPERYARLCEVVRARSERLDAHG